MSLHHQSSHSRRNRHSISAAASSNRHSPQHQAKPTPFLQLQIPAKINQRQCRILSPLLPRPKHHNLNHNHQLISPPPLPPKPGSPLLPPLNPHINPSQPPHPSQNPIQPTISTLTTNPWIPHPRHQPQPKKWT